jgi:hypothetical protein
LSSGRFFGLSYDGNHIIAILNKILKGRDGKAGSPEKHDFSLIFWHILDPAPIERISAIIAKADLSIGAGLIYSLKYDIIKNEVTHNDE